MNPTRSALTFVVILSIALAACAWKPAVTPVLISEPWSEMNLPVKENAVVWTSTATEFKAVHKEDKKTVATKYVEALGSQGWKVDKFDDSEPSNYRLDMSKAADRIRIEFYDFDRTGVIVKKL